MRRPGWLVFDWSQTIFGTQGPFADPPRRPSLRRVLDIVTPLWAFWMIWYVFIGGLVEAATLALPVLVACIVLLWLLLFGRWQLHVARHETQGRHPVVILVLRALGLLLLAPFVLALGLVGVLDLVGWEGRNVAAGVIEVVLAALIAGLGYLAVRRAFLGGSLLLVPPLTLSGCLLLAAAILERHGRGHDRAGSEPVQQVGSGAREVPTATHGRRTPPSPADRAPRPPRDPRHASRVDGRSRPVSQRRGDRRG